VNLVRKRKKEERRGPKTWPKGTNRDNSHQRGIGTIPVLDLLRQGCSTPLNRLGSHQPSIKPTAGLPHLLWSMDKHGRTLRRTLEGRDHRCQHVVVGVLDRGEVIVVGHCHD
jgi:hypothetical protein